MALNLSRGCGNPTGFANLQPGDVVVDFGCGGGIDVILAARKVGPQGRVVGIDFTCEMIIRARQTVAEMGLQDWNIDLRIAAMENTQLPGRFANVIISNCVINLCPEKEAVYREAFRILRPDGRVAISDIVLLEDIEPELRARFQSIWVGCLGGAILADEYFQIVKKVGFSEIQIVAQHILTSDELAAMACCPGKDFTPPPGKEDLMLVVSKVASTKFTAVRPPAN
ncbi:MAG: methyltransferase domain-containing protein [bacterium]